MINLIAKLWTDRRGVSMLEYGLLATLIAIVASVAIKGVGTTLATTFTDISTTIKASQ